MSMQTLSPHPWRRAPEGPVVAIVMDGVGIGTGDHGDAVAQARTPVLDALRGLPSFTSLLAHGTAVGMPSDADMGNSEVGHNALGAGRIVDQGAKLVSEAIASGALFTGDAWQQAVITVKQSGEPLHFIGLLSDGNVHSHIDHLIALLQHAASEGVQRARVHALVDGRDVPGRSALLYIDRLEQVLANLSQDGRDYRIASGGGRMVVTMDRYEADWQIVARGWQIHVRGEGRRFPSARAAVETLYKETGLDDQNLPGFVIADEHGPVGPIRDGAAVLLFNFRGDRALELTRAFEEDDFTGFVRGERPRIYFAGMTQYDGDLKLPRRYLVAPPAIAGTMGEMLATSGVSQLAISETHKFGHVTYFWNGNRSEPFDPALETYVEIPSDLTPLEQRPWMKAAEITDRLIAEIDRIHPASSASTSPTATWSATPATSTPRSSPSRPSTCASAASSPPCSAARASPSSPPTTATPTRCSTAAPMAPSRSAPATPSIASPSPSSTPASPAAARASLRRPAPASATSPPPASSCSATPSPRTCAQACWRPCADAWSPGAPALTRADRPGGAPPASRGRPALLMSAPSRPETAR
jgi:2,3-bisphosphoglycerate-independent phosphoglycerate mutase